MCCCLPLDVSGLVFAVYWLLAGGCRVLVVVCCRLSCGVCRL